MVSRVAPTMDWTVQDAQELLRRRVDIVTEASLHPALRDRVLADAVPL